MTKVEHKFNKGDKFIIEIAEVHTHYLDNGLEYPLYRIKGFDSMVMTDTALNKFPMYHCDTLERKCKNCTRYQVIYDGDNKVCDACAKYYKTVEPDGCCDFFRMTKRGKE